MSTVSKRPNVKLAKLFYKYAEEMKKEPQPAAQGPEPGGASPAEAEQGEGGEGCEGGAPYPPNNFSWFVENKLAAMGWPRCVANLDYLADAGVDHLVTLSPEKLPPILECKKKLKWTEIPIKEFGVPTLKQIIKFMEICERAELRGEVVGVHCRQGRGRTGALLACYLVRFRHLAPERAVLTVRLQRPGSCETYEQEKIVCHYHDCLRGTVALPDYYLVDSKLCFDLCMKHRFRDEVEGVAPEGEGGAQEGSCPECGTPPFPDTLQLNKKRKKSKAMVINHKIYF